MHDHDHEAELANANAVLDVLHKAALLINDQVVNLKSLTETEKQELRLALVVVMRASQGMLLDCSFNHYQAGMVCQQVITMTCAGLVRHGIMMEPGGSVDTMEKYFAKLRKRKRTGKPKKEGGKR